MKYFVAKASLFRILCFLLLQGSVWPGAYAQTALDSLQHIREVVVRAKSNQEVIPAQKLSGKQLESLSSFSVADAIRYFAGVQIKDYGGIGGLKTVDIRSMGTHHMGVFYDGIQLGNAQNGQIDLGKFSLDNIEEINLYNGQRSEVFQPAKSFGSAGTVYLRSRRPKFKEGKKTNVLATFRTGSFDLVNPSVLWEQKLSPTVSSSFNAEYIYSSGKYSFRYRKKNQDGTMAWDTTAIRRNGDIQSLRLEGGLNGTINDGFWNFKAYYYDSERGIPGAIVNNVWKHSQRQWDKNLFLQGSLQKKISEKYELQFNMKYANDRMRYFNPDSTLKLTNNTFHQQEVYLSVANKYSILPNWDVNLSADYLWNTLDANLPLFMYPIRNTYLVAVATAFEWHRLKAQASWLGTFVFDRITKKDLGKNPPDKQEYTPAVFLSYQPFEDRNLSFRAFYKQIFRMPTFNDLYYTDVGNSDLKPEYTSQYNLGFQYLLAWKRATLQFRADAYYNEVTNKIVAIPKGNGQYRWMMMNLGSVEIRGVDVSVQGTKDFPWDIKTRASLNYTWQKAQDLTYPGTSSYRGQIAYIPWHNGSAILNLERKTWDVNYSFIYVGERYHNSDNKQANYEQPWYTHDLTLSKTFLLKGLFRGKSPETLRLSAEVNNILNQYYDVVVNYPMPGRNYRLVLKVEI